MGVSVGLLQFKGFAVRPEDVTFGEAATKDLQFLSSGGSVMTASFKRPSVSIVLRGLTQQQAQPFIQIAQQAAFSLFTGAAPRELIAIAGFQVPDAVLVSAIPSAPIQIAGEALIDQIALTYESQVFV